MGHVSYIHYFPVGNVCVQIPTSSVRITQRNNFFLYDWPWAICKLQAHWFSFIECKNCSGMQARITYHKQGQACQICIDVSIFKLVAHFNLDKDNLLKSPFQSQIFTWLGSTSRQSCKWSDPQIFLIFCCTKQSKIHYIFLVTSEKRKQSLHHISEEDCWILLQAIFACSSLGGSFASGGVACRTLSHTFCYTRVLFSGF